MKTIYISIVALLFFIPVSFAQQTDASFGCLTDGPNSAGAWLAGALPHRSVGGVALHEGG